MQKAWLNTPEWQLCAICCVLTWMRVDTVNSQHCSVGPREALTVSLHQELGKKSQKCSHWKSLRANLVWVSFWAPLILACLPCRRQSRLSVWDQLCHPRGAWCVWSVVCLVTSTIIKHVSGLDLSFDEMQKVGVHSFFKILTRGYALLILEREEGRDRERINVREISCLPYAPQLGVEPTT